MKNFTEKKFKIYRESVNFTGKGVILQKRCKLFYSLNFTDKSVYVALKRYRNFRVSCEHFFFTWKLRKGQKRIRISQYIALKRYMYKIIYAVDKKF